MWATDQVDALVDLYWEDAMLIPPVGGRTPIRGRDRIREYFTGVLPEQGLRSGRRAGGRHPARG